MVFNKNNNNFIIMMIMSCISYLCVFSTCTWVYTHHRFDTLLYDIFATIRGKAIKIGQIWRICMVYNVYTSFKRKNLKFLFKNFKSIII